MTERERLVELISQCNAKNLNMVQLLEFEKLLLADHLLANGVIVLQDHLYCVASNKKPTYSDILKAVEETTKTYEPMSFEEFMQMLKERERE